MKLINKIILSTIALTATGPGMAAATTGEHMIVAPNCLIKQIASIKPLTSNQSLSLIRANQHQLDLLIEAKAKPTPTACGGFVDVSYEWNHQARNISYSSFLSNYSQPRQTTKASATNYGINYSKQVETLLKTINPQDIWQDLTTLSQFQDRYANSDTGVKASDWIFSTLREMAKDRNDVSFYVIETGYEYKQPSVIMKVGTSNAPGIVIGAHMDTLRAGSSPKPGADDDGSGSSSVLEVARTILASKMTFKKPIYFMWYSAEEEGLIGSGYVVRYFKANAIPVDAVLHMDMTGYEYKNDPTMYLIKDNTDSDLTSFLGKLISTYVKVPVSSTSCGYACSDHASWDKAGYKAAISFESSFRKMDPYIHSSNDKMDVLSLEHMTNFAQLGVAFATELAEPLQN